MAIRNVFGAQSIRQKLLLGTLFLAIIPVAVTSIIVGRESLNSGRAALESQAREALVAQRASKAAQITDYFDALSNQVQVLAASPDVVGAMRELPAAYDNSVISIADLPAERVRLGKYYTGDFMAEFQKRNTGKTLNMAESVAALPDVAMNLQYQYIAANPNPLGAKNNLDHANDGSRYSELHGAIHPYLRTALRQFGLYDIFLVEPRNGTIVYTVFKELDFATSLVSGPFTKTKLGDAFRQTWALDKPGMVALSEFGEYLPSYNDQAAFLGTPIFDGGKKIGVLLVQVPIDKINSVMTHEGKWKERGLGDSGETYLVSAADGTPRSIARLAAEDIEAYAQERERRGLRQGTRERRAGQGHQHRSRADQDPGHPGSIRESRVRIRRVPELREDAGARRLRAAERARSQVGHRGRDQGDRSVRARDGACARKWWCGPPASPSRC